MWEWAQATSDLLRSVLMAITLIIHTLARLTAITALTGSLAGSSSARAPGSTAGMDAPAGMGADTTGDPGLGDGPDSLAAALGLSDTARQSRPAADLPTVQLEAAFMEVADSMEEAVDSTVEAGSTAAGIVNR